MYGKKLKEINKKYRVIIVRKKKYSLYRICYQKEFSYFKLFIKNNTNIKIDNYPLYLHLTKGKILFNKKNIIKNHEKKTYFSKKTIYFKTLENSELFIFFLHKVNNLKISINKKSIKTIVQLIRKSKIKNKYWGKIITLFSNKKGSGKIIFMKKNTQSSMEFHLKKKENYFIENGMIELGIRYARGRNGLIILRRNNSFLMEPGTMHMRMAKKDSKIIEISTEDNDKDSMIVHDGNVYKFKKD